MMANPQDGSTHRFVGLEGDDGERVALGSDSNALQVGTEVTVRETVPAAEQGAHDDAEDAVVIEWKAPALVHTDNGVEVGEVDRAMSIAASQFSDLFEGA